MPLYLRLTSIVTLLISLQLLSPKLIPTQAAWNLFEITSNHSFIATNHNLREDTATGQSSPDDFIPIDYGHPNNTRGSGTR